MRCALLVAGWVVLSCASRATPTPKPERPAPRVSNEAIAELLAVLGPYCGGPEGVLDCAPGTFAETFGDHLSDFEGNRSGFETALMASLDNGTHYAAYALAWLGTEDALPSIRRNLLTDRYFYGWEGSDSPGGESRDEQYPHHQAYLMAIEQLSGKPAVQAVALTGREWRALAADDSNAARWLLGKLSTPTALHQALDSYASLDEIPPDAWTERHDVRIAEETGIGITPSRHLLIQGTACRAGKPIEFFDNGQLHLCLLLVNQVVDGIPCRRWVDVEPGLFSQSLQRREDGSLFQCVVDEDLEISGHAVTAGNMGSVHNGVLDGMYIYEPQRVAGIELEPGDHVSFTAGGALAALSFGSSDYKDTAQRVRLVRGFSCAGNAGLEFHLDGSVERFVSAVDTEIDGVHVPHGAMVLLGPDGKITHVSQPRPR